MSLLKILRFLKTISFVFAGLLLIIFACSTNNQSFLKTEKRYPPWNDDVKVYYYTSREAYKKIGIVSTKGSAKVPMHYLIADLQQKAANIGASRIYVHPPTVGVDFVKLTAKAIR